MGEPSWQELLRLRLVERNSKESSFAPIIEQCTFSTFGCQIDMLIVCPSDRRLAQQTKLLKERNASLLKAVGSVRANPSSSTVYVPGTGEESVSTSILLDQSPQMLTISLYSAIPCERRTWLLWNLKYPHFVTS